jgi:hypothetical protein
MYAAELSPAWCVITDYPEMEAPTMAPTERDTDTYARDSFTWRGMAKWQVWSISIAAAVIVVLLLAYVI